MEIIQPPAPFELNTDQQFALMVAMESFLKDYPYLTLDIQTGAVTFNIYDQDVLQEIAVIGSLSALLSKAYPGEQQTLTVEPAFLTHIQAATHVYLARETNREIAQHDAGNPQPPKDYVTELRELYIKITDHTDTRNKVSPWTALELGIGALIPYETIWEYAQSYPEIEADSNWAALHRQALHLLQLRAIALDEEV